jgi:hypothetical protein
VRNALGLDGTAEEVAKVNAETLLDSSVKMLNDELGEDSHLDEGQHQDIPDSGEVEKE